VGAEKPPPKVSTPASVGVQKRARGVPVGTRGCGKGTGKKQLMIEEPRAGSGIEPAGGQNRITNISVGVTWERRCLSVNRVEKGNRTHFRGGVPKHDIFGVGLVESKGHSDLRPPDHHRT